MRSTLWIALVCLTASVAYADEDPPPAAPANPSEITVGPGGQTSAPVDVQPFGGITWRDSLPQIVATLNKLGKFEEANLDINGALTSVKGMTTPAAVEKALDAAVRKQINNKGALQAKFKTFKDKSGREWHYFGSFIKLHAKTLNISGVPYTVDLEFMGSPGALVLQEKAVTFSKGQPALATPYYLKAMYLEPPSSGLSEQKHAVWAAVRKKYPMLTEGAYGDARLTGIQGHMEFHSGSLRYTGYDDRYEKAAKDLKNARESAGKSDQSNQL